MNYTYDNGVTAQLSEPPTTVHDEASGRSGRTPASRGHSLFAVVLVSLLASCQQSQERPPDATVTLDAMPGHATGYSTDPSTWEVIDRPSKNDHWDYWAFHERARLSDDEWAVDSVNGRPVARRLEDRPPDPSSSPSFDTTVELRLRKAPAFLTARVSDGWIAAYEAVDGDGAAVFWFSTDGEQKVRLSDHQINDFLVEGDRIIAAAGLAHNRASNGSVVEIFKSQGVWTATERFTLQSVVQSIGRVDDGDYVIATRTMLLRVNLPTQEMLVLVPRAGPGGWIGSANSVAVDEQHVYIGMRQFVARCKLGRSVQELEFLVSSSEWLAKPIEERDVAPFSEQFPQE